MCPGDLWWGQVGRRPGGDQWHEPALRNERNANSLVVALDADDLAPFEPSGIRWGIALQRELEERAFGLGQQLAAPAQQLEDFLASRPSTVLVARRINRVCIPPIWMICCPRPSLRPREALPAFARKLKDAAPDAVLTGVETHTSSPVRIPEMTRSNAQCDRAGAGG